MERMNSGMSDAMKKRKERCEESIQWKRQNHREKRLTLNGAWLGAAVITLSCKFLTVCIQYTSRALRHFAPFLSCTQIRHENECTTSGKACSSQKNGRHRKKCDSVRQSKLFVKRSRNKKPWGDSTARCLILHEYPSTRPPRVHMYI